MLGELQPAKYESIPSAVRFALVELLRGRAMRLKVLSMFVGFHQLRETPGITR